MDDYRRIEEVIRFLGEDFQSQPSLSALAKRVGLSDSHFQRLFLRWAGVTPKEFLQCLTHSHAKRLLDRGESVLDAALDSGLSGPGRLHDLCIKLEAATPGEIKSGGAGWKIVYGFAVSDFGRVLVASGPRGICHLSFVDSQSNAEAIVNLRGDWAAADFERDDGVAVALCKRVFSNDPNETGATSLRACVAGSVFQIQVWQALLRIPAGDVSTYKRVASSIGRPGAVRTVGTAIGRNPIAVLIPCHRVIRESGALGGYRWGLPRKQALIGREATFRA
ncbi:MAG: methylated-DNA--[protein]-cysteine S-methyltransferase [Opitutales bacterium]|jgi:AraC family transcriptional regulator, regulatory protein of adaptative response / methylated-DNA-[protein]-cysteine methyltransferase|nr:methylated-DNA--[protein]-cysteine S-methyltransferase [Opitutales bacterium]